MVPGAATKKARVYGRLMFADNPAQPLRISIHTKHPKAAPEITQSKPNGFILHSISIHRSFLPEAVTSIRFSQSDPWQA